MIKPPLTTVFVGELTTRHFHFVCVETTDAKARRALGRAWKKHARETGAIDTYALEDFEVRPYQIGPVYRDGEVFSK